MNCEGSRIKSHSSHIHVQSSHSLRCRRPARRIRLPRLHGATERCRRRHASQRARAKRGPMTGSAKQSRATHATLDCFVALLLAMTTEGHEFTFSRRNSPELCIIRYPRRNEGAGKTGWPLHPGPPRKRCLRERDDHRYRRRHSGLPCAVVYGLYALSPVNQRLPPSPHAHLAQSLAPAWARQDHTSL
jgi:uncharacterized protein (DUF3084 family)